MNLVINLIFEKESDENFQNMTETISDENGKYTFKVECDNTYYVRAIKEEYETIKT